jgi:hypothetical protein
VRFEITTDNPALSFCLSMMFFEKPVSTLPDHALAGTFARGGMRPHAIDLPADPLLLSGQSKQAWGRKQ